MDYKHDKATSDALNELVRPKNGSMLNKALSTGKTDQTNSGRHKWFWLAPGNTQNQAYPRPYAKENEKEST